MDLLYISDTITTTITILLFKVSGTWMKMTLTEQNMTENMISKLNDM